MGRVQILARKRFIISLSIIVILTQLLACVCEVRAQGAADEVPGAPQKSEGREAAAGQNQ